MNSYHHDSIGRLINLPYAVREALVTAHASLTTGTNTTLLTGDSASKLDLIQIGFSNNSDAATSVTLSDDGTTINIYPVPAATANQFNYQIPIPQNKAGGNWQVDLPDITGTTITVRGLFIKQ